MEDYTYNFVKGKEGILEAHMLEVCPSIADGPVSIKVCPLSMARLRMMKSMQQLWQTWKGSVNSYE